MTNVVVQNPDDSIILGTNDYVPTQPDVESNVTRIEAFTELEFQHNIDLNHRDMYLFIDNINCTLTADFILNIISVVFIFKSLPISIINIIIIFYGYMAIYINTKPLIILFIILLTFVVVFKMFLVVSLLNNTYIFINIFICMDIYHNLHSIRQLIKIHKRFHISLHIIAHL